MLNFRSLSVQFEAIVAFVLLTLVSIGVVSWIGYVSARESLRASAERELVGLERSKAALVGRPAEGRTQRGPHVVGLAGHDGRRS